MTDFASELRDGMRIDWDVPIRVDDGLVLRAGLRAVVCASVEGAPDLLGRERDVDVVDTEG